MVQNVGGSLGQDGALADQIVRSHAARVERRTRDGKNLAPLIERHFGRDKGTGLQGRFDDDNA
jgi:hypothetical protein